MKILVHMPTKGRGERAALTLEGYRDHAEGEVIYSVACNSVEDVPAFSPAIVLIDNYTSKIAAYNAIPLDLQWDLVLAASDDMWCVQKGWDTIIREAMITNFPDTNGCLWFSDGRQDRICTFSIMGRKAYELDGYVYHHDYLSFFSDNEWTDTWAARGKLHKDSRCLFRNEHPAWGGVMPNDATYKGNDRAWQHDKTLYHVRKLQGYPKT